MIYRFYILQAALVRRLYPTPNKDRTANVSVLAAFLFLFNIHSILMLLEYYHIYEFGLFDFWKPTNQPKSTLGGLIGISFIIPYYGVYVLSKKTTTLERRTQIIRKELSRNTSILVVAIYVIATVTFLISMFILSINRILN